MSKEDQFTKEERSNTQRHESIQANGYDASPKASEYQRPVSKPVGHQPWK